MQFRAQIIKLLFILAKEGNWLKPAKHVTGFGVQRSNKMEWF